MLLDAHSKEEYVLVDMLLLYQYREFLIPSLDMFLYMLLHHDPLCIGVIFLLSVQDMAYTEYAYFWWP